jgi:choline kinase
MSIPQAIILAAGLGSRLRSAAPSKPLAEVGGRTLLAHALTGLTRAGVGEIVVVLGYEADRVAAHIAEVGDVAPVRIVRNPDWTAPNGVSVLAAAPAIRGPALLTMCDHLVEPDLYRRVAQAARPGLVLGVDRRIGHPWVDEDDVTRVATRDGEIVAIGKHLPVYDCYDTGVFTIDSRLFGALATLESPSLSAGVAQLAGEGAAGVVDTGDLGWLDVDDPRALAIAEDWVNDPVRFRAF